MGTELTRPQRHPGANAPQALINDLLEARAGKNVMLVRPDRLETAIASAVTCKPAAPAPLSTPKLAGHKCMKGDTLLVPQEGGGRSMAAPAFKERAHHWPINPMLISAEDRSAGGLTDANLGDKVLNQVPVDLPPRLFCQQRNDLQGRDLEQIDLLVKYEEGKGAVPRSTGTKHRKVSCRHRATDVNPPGRLPRLLPCLGKIPPTIGVIP